jgi:hypothetical protein
VQAVAKDGTIVICDLRLNEIKVGDGSEKFFVGSMLFLACMSTDTTLY